MILFLLGKTVKEPLDCLSLLLTLTGLLRTLKTQHLNIIRKCVSRAWEEENKKRTSLLAAGVPTEGDTLPRPWSLSQCLSWPQQPGCQPTAQAHLAISPWSSLVILGHLSLPLWALGREKALPRAHGRSRASLITWRLSTSHWPQDTKSRATFLLPIRCSLPWKEPVRKDASPSKKKEREKKK